MTTFRDPADAECAEPAPAHCWQGVTVVMSHARCAAVGRLEGRCFAAAEAPRLPVIDCDLPDDCDCTYRHLTERRMRQRRAAVANGVPAAERRASRGRRATD